jgi:hypothetical protein
MHLHYSPFQFGTEEGDVSATKIVKAVKSLTKKDTSKTHNMGSTMSCAAADTIPGTPNAFTSPNPVGVMKDIKMPLAPTGVSKTPAMSRAYDHSYRHRTREGYGDRNLEGNMVKAMSYAS